MASSEDCLCSVNAPGGAGNLVMAGQYSMGFEQDLFLADCYGQCFSTQLSAKQFASFIMRGHVLMKEIMVYTNMFVTFVQNRENT